MKKLDKILENKKLLFLFVFLYGSIIYIFMYYPTFGLDGYCQLAQTYKHYANNFLIAGRFITAMLWFIFDFIHMSHYLLSVVGHLLAIIFLSLSAITIYSAIKKKISKKIIYKVILLLGSVLIVFNPFSQGILVFEESFCMALAVYISIKTAIIISDDVSKKNCIKCTALMLCANFLYQGCISYFIPVVLIMNIIDNQDKKIKTYIKNNYKKVIAYALVFGISCIIEFISLQVYVKLAHAKMAKVGKIDLLANLAIIKELFYKTYFGMLSMINPTIFRYSLYTLLSIIFLRIIVNFKTESKYIVHIVFIIMVALLSSFIPNVVMKTSLNYTAPRLLLTFGAVIGFLLVLSTLIYDKKEKKLNKYYGILILVVGIFFFINNSYAALYNSFNDYERYKADREYIDNVNNEINAYEKDNVKIEYIYYNIDEIDRPNYLGKYYNVNHLRICSSDWGLECGIKAFIRKNIKVEEMPKKKYKEMKKDNTLIMFDNDKMFMIFK